MPFKKTILIEDGRGKIQNPETGRWVNKTGKLGMKILAQYRIQAETKAEKKEAKEEKKDKRELPINPIHSNQGLFGRYGHESSWKKLGEGGFGEAFSAYDKSNNTTVVLKRMNTKESKNKATFAREVSILTYLQKHCRPYFVCYIDAFQTETHYYLIMEFLNEYIDLHDYILSELGNQPIAISRLIMENLLNGLQWMHRLGVVHRDIKPENIMICISKEHLGQIRFIDFGFACRDADCVRFPGIGTIIYYAPEQVMLDQMNAAQWRQADIWQLGLTCYALLSSQAFWQVFQNTVGIRNISNALALIPGIHERQYTYELREGSKTNAYVLALQYMTTLPAGEFQSIMHKIIVGTIVSHLSPVDIVSEDFEWCEKMLLNMIDNRPGNRTLSDKPKMPVRLAQKEAERKSPSDV